MKPHAFTPGPNPKICSVCSGGPALSLHLAYDDVAPATDGGQRWGMIRGTKP